jgi:alkenylglycerophosphocholine/alkenylglycerophosphoethanolamine hydrolase
VRVLPIAAMWLTGLLAIQGHERGVRWLEVVFKPLTTILLLLVIGVPHTTFARLISAGVVLSLIGDIALLNDDNRAFMVGLGAFLLAHVAYTIAFLGAAVWSPFVPVVAVVMLVSTIWLLRATWMGTSRMHAPTIAYAVVISVMVVSAWAMIGGPLALAPFAAVGAVLFYVSDASLALNRFRRPVPHVSLLALGVYWIGQLGIAIAASSAF